MRSRFFYKQTLRVLSLILLFVTLVGCHAPADDKVAMGTKSPDAALITVNGIGLENFVIVHEDEVLFRNAAEYIREKISQSYGYELAVIADGDGEYTYEILVGNVKRELTKDYYERILDKFNRYEVVIKGEKIALLATEKLNLDIAKADFVDRLFADGKTDKSITDASSFVGDVYSASSVAIEKRVNSTDIRIASNNIFFHQKTDDALYSKRRSPLLHSFALMDADVLMLQECGYLRSSSPSKTTWHDEIDGELEDMGYTQVPVTLELGASMNYTPIWYRADKLRLIESNYNLYDSVKYKPDSFLSDSKSYTTAVFEDKNTGKTFACISTHFTWADDNAQKREREPLSGELRASDAEEAKAEVLALKEKYGEELPIILMGDLNTEVQSQPYKILQTVMTNALYLENIKKNNTSYSTTHVLGSKPGTGSAIDHTFVSGTGYRALQYQHVVNFWALTSTDHIPLLLDIDLTQN